MSREKFMDIIEEIQIRNYNKFKGSNEADLMIREEIADLVFSIPPPVNKTAEEILNGYLPEGSREYGEDCWTKEMVINGMEEYANQFKR